MKKILYRISIFIFSFMLQVTTTYAYTFDVSATSTSVTVGNTISLNIKVTDAAGKFTISSSNPAILSVGTSSLWIDNTTSSVTLKANATGVVTISVDASDVTTYDGENVSITKEIKFTVNPKPTVSNNTTNNNTIPTRTKSANNFLSSLTIENYEFSETFDKEKLDYTLTVPADTESIKINAQLADSNASVTGLGEIKLTTGTNNLQIVVTAENGSKRTYNLKVTVEELKPLSVRIDNQLYNIVRKKEDLPKVSEYYLYKEITIDNNAVASYYNQVLDYTLVGLKDTNGNIAFYKYKDGKYAIYKEYTFNGTTLEVIDKEISDKYKQTKFYYDGSTINAYQEVTPDLIKNTYALDIDNIANNQFYLFYGINIETGKEYLYQYDSLEKTVQRYNTELLDIYKNNNNTYYTYLLGSIFIIGLLIVTMSIILITSSKDKRNYRMMKYNKEKYEMKLEEDDIPVKSKRKRL